MAPLVVVVVRWLLLLLLLLRVLVVLVVLWEEDNCCCAATYSCCQIATVSVLFSVVVVAGSLDGSFVSASPSFSVTISTTHLLRLVLVVVVIMIGRSARDVHVGTFHKDLVVTR